MKYLYLIFAAPAILSCNLQADSKKSSFTSFAFKPIISSNDSLEIIEYCNSIKNNRLSSISKGTVSNGSLENGKIFPYFGNNFTYFYKESYLASRAFTSDIVKDIILDTYAILKRELPNRHFFLMELSNKHGGKMFPHKTHQNGLSADFMMPKTKDNEAYYDLDTIGKKHYWLEFTDNGEYLEDKTIKIDFELIARHALLLNKIAKEKGYKISKVIIKIEYKNNLFSGQYGKLLQNSDIYIVKGLTPLINSLHDDHYHIDFEKI